MGNTEHAHDESLVERLERLKALGENVKVRSIRAKANLDQAHKEYAKAKETAEREYGTSDPAKLKELLEKWRASNEAEVAEYERILRETQSKLDDLDKVLG